jgi:hypothetical protein
MLNRISRALSFVCLATAMICVGLVAVEASDSPCSTGDFTCEEEGSGVCDKHKNEACGNLDDCKCITEYIMTTGYCHCLK